MAEENVTLILGLTGGIAAGKSTVAAIFAELGAVIVSADQLAREVAAPGSPTLQALVSIFGPEIVDAAGGLDRPALARVVFADPAARQQLNALIHPAIGRLAKARLQTLRDRKVPLVIYEAPLLLEAGAERRVDRILTVIVDAETQRARLTARDRLPGEEIDARISAQWPQAEKVARADYVIDNSGTPAETRQQVTALHQYLMSRGQP